MSARDEEAPGTFDTAMWDVLGRVVVLAEGDIAYWKAMALLLCADLLYRTGHWNGRGWPNVAP